MEWINLILFIVSAVILFSSSSLLVRALENIARFLRITEFTAGFIIMAIATSLPELFVGISSAVEKSPALSLGNIIGANILNLTLVTGMIILVSRGAKIKTRQTKKESVYMISVAILPLILFLVDGKLGRIDGIILIATFCMYIYHLVKERKGFKKPLEDNISRYGAVFNTSLFMVLLIIMFFSAKYIIHYGKLLAIDMNMPLIMVGFFLISLGTVLPEMTFGIIATLKGKGEMAIGDQVGTIVVNSTLILGIVSLIMPITANVTLFMIGAAFLIVSTFLFTTFFYIGYKLYVIEGIALILLYLLFVFVEFFTKGMIG